MAIGGDYKNSQIAIILSGLSDFAEICYVDAKAFPKEDTCQTGTGGSRQWPLY